MISVSSTKSGRAQITRKWTRKTRQRFLEVFRKHSNLSRDSSLYHRHVAEFRLKALGPALAQRSDVSQMKVGRHRFQRLLKPFQGMAVSKKDHRAGTLLQETDQQMRLLAAVSVKIVPSQIESNGVALARIT